MAQFSKSNDGVLNSGTPVDIVPAPSASTSRVVRFVNFYNGDSAAVTVTLRFVSAGGTRVLWKVTLQAGESIKDETLPVCDATTKSITAIQTAPVSTQCDFVATYGDET
jgi:hypothetical protein